MPKTNSESAAIKNILEEQVAAWNNGDAEGFSRYVAADATFTNIIGMFFIGHNNFLERHKQIINGPFRNTVLRQKLISLKFIHAQAAVVETLLQVSGCPESPLPGIYIDEQGRLHTRLLQVMVKDLVSWKITAYHNVDIKAGVPVPKAQGS